MSVGWMEYGEQLMTGLGNLNFKVITWFRVDL